MSGRSQIHEVAVVGGGVAGCATVIALAREGLVPIWVTPGIFGRAVPFGDSLAPAARPVLVSLGLGGLLQDPRHRASNAIFSSWGSEMLNERNSALHLEGPGLVLDREAFESSLADAARQCCETRAAISRSAGWADGAWRLVLDDGTSVQSRFVIDATGRSAAIGRRMVPVRSRDRMVGAVTHVRQRSLDLEVTRATLIEAMPEGWLYAAVLAEGRMSIAYFSDPDLLPRGLRNDLDAWKALVAGSVHVSRWLDDAGFEIVEPPSITAAGTSWLERAAGAGVAGRPPWAAVGDAAAAMDPLSSHGLTTSLWSGARAGSAVAAWLAGDASPLARYSDSVSGGVQRYLAEQMAVYGHERRFSERPFWSRRAAGGALAAR